MKMNTGFRNKFAVAVVMALLAGGSGARALTLQFDYTYDDGGFFTGANASRQSILNAAATVFTSRITDSLSAITPGGSSSWTASPFDPRNTASNLSISNPSIAANTILIYVGASALGGSTLGVGGPGGYGASGFQAWFDTLEGRGQAGALGPDASKTDFAPWGGTLAFNNASAWYFDSDVTTVESGAMVGLNDFYSVAVHEIGHLMGIGTADSWTNRISGTVFTGPTTGSVSVNAGADHWANGTSSFLPGTATAQEAAMDPSITVGTRKYFTELDYAGLADIGWTVSPIPEPSTYAMLAGVGVLGLAAWSRRRRRSE